MRNLKSTKRQLKLEVHLKIDWVCSLSLCQTAIWRRFLPPKRNARTKGWPLNIIDNSIQKGLQLLTSITVQTLYLIGPTMQNSCSLFRLFRNFEAASSFHKPDHISTSKKWHSLSRNHRNIIIDGLHNKIHIIVVVNNEELFVSSVTIVSKNEKQTEIWPRLLLNVTQISPSSKTSTHWYAKGVPIMFW